MITVDTTLAGRYRLEARIGRGGMAEVYRALDLVLERPVAVKVVRGTDDEDARRFAAEIRAMAALNHPNVVGLFDAGTHEDAPFLVMELVEGPTLPTVLADGPLDSSRASSLGRGLASGLGHAHDLGVVHRDVKPSNVLIDADGRPRLSDFGIARLADATRLTSTGMTTGTAGYLAPEQLTDAPVTPAADIYALGLVLLECLTGRQEFTGTAVEAAMARLNRDPRISDDLPPGWQGLLHDMTARQPGRRPTAAEVEARLRTGHEGAPAPEPERGADEDTIALGAMTAATDQPATNEPAGGHEEAAAPARSHRHAWRGRPLTTIVVVVLLATALVLVFLGGSGEDDPGHTRGGPADQDTSTVPEELDDALERLEEAVAP